MSLDDCGTRQMPALGRIRAVQGWIGLVLLSLAIGACATPISVTRLDPRVAQQELTRNVLYSGETSSFSQIIPNRQDLASQYDRRFRDACDLYNRALTAALRSEDGTRIEIHARVFPLPFGELGVSFDPAQLHWLDRQLTEFVPVVDLRVDGMRNRYRRSGLGAPLAASTVAGSAREGLYLPLRLKAPVTLFPRLEEPWQQL